MLIGGVSCTGQAQGSRCSSSRSPLTKQLTRTRVSQKSRRCRIRKLPSQRGKPINSGRRSRRRLSASCGSKRRQRKTEEKEKEKEKKAKEDERANRKRKEEEDKLATAAAAASPLRKKGQLRASRPPCNVVSGLACPRATARATAIDWRPHIPLDHDCRWTTPDIQPQTQLCYCAGVVSA